jgi:membrane-bound lytic murein transglycosylase D
VDERLDPIRSAAAAALFLKNNFNRLRSWPLAITAYNHGPAGIERAVLKTGSSNLSDIIRKYESDSFGFASANYYVSFLAAVKIMQNSWLYFGESPAASRLEFDEFIMPDPVLATDLLEYAALDSKEIRELNPALLESVWSGRMPVPVGYVLRIPMSARDRFISRYESIPAQKRGRR